MPASSRVLQGRRRFVQLMGWAGVVAMARGGPALAQAATKTRPKSGKPPAAPPPPATPAAGAKPEISAEARALADVVQQRHGEHLRPEDIETVARDIDGDLRGAKRMREVKLANADEPDVTFSA